MDLPLQEHNRPVPQIDDISKAFEVDLGKEINDCNLTADDFKSDDDILDEVICIFD